MGDALFVVIEPYHYSMIWPSEGGTYGGEGMDGEPEGDRWDWTLGIEQYLWLKDTLENSDATFKFVLSHHVTGGATPYGRGGIEAAPYFEWGGQNADGTWGFDDQRPGWGGVPIHQLMVENGVSAYFHGHDHQFVYESLDGVVYQEVPSPSMSGSGFSGIYSESDSFTHAILPNAGHLRVTVTPIEATVEYVRSNTTDVSYTYTIQPNQTPTAPVSFNILLGRPTDESITANIIADQDVEFYIFLHQ